MNSSEIVLTSGAVAMLVMEGIKYIYRNLILKNPTADLPTLFYNITMPILSAIAPFFLLGIGVQTTDPILTMDIQGVITYLLRTGVTALVAYVTYNQALKPAKNYARFLTAKEYRGLTKPD